MNLLKRFGYVGALHFEMKCAYSSHRGFSMHRGDYLSFEDELFVRRCAKML
jgi:hypothetical protein